MIVNKKIEKNNNKQNKGFTLIEVMVSVSLFAMVMTLSLGAILSIIDGNKKAQAINSVANNLNFAVESMVRDIKTGYAYTCSANNDSITVSSTTQSDVQNGGNGCDSYKTSPVQNISLVSTITGTKRGVKYYLERDTDGTGRIKKITSDTNAVAYPVTSPEVDIKKLDFYVDNPVSSTYSGQPRVFLIIKGTAVVNPTQTSDFTIQTLISQRNLNLPTN